jgi:hypothetical protein
MRVSHTFRYGRVRLQPFMEIFNLLNLSTLLTVNETVGPNYFQPAVIVPARGPRGEPMSRAFGSGTRFLLELATAAALVAAATR